MVMLTHNYRFHGHGSLRYLFRKGQTARTRHLMVRYVTNTQRLHSRCAVVISKKVFKSAVKRNRARRRIFEIVRHALPELRATYDFTITIYSGEVVTMSHDDLRREVHQLLAAARLLKDNSPAS